MSIETPTVLKKILARKEQEVADRKAKVSIEQLKAQLKSASVPRGFAAALQS